MDDMNPAMRDLFLGGEDEETQDVETVEQKSIDHPPIDLHQPAARHAYLNIDIRSNEDGTVTAWHFTNDRDADGTPDRQGSGWAELLVTWSEHHPSVEDALAEAGRSRTEPSGRVVTVLREGRR